MSAPKDPRKGTLRPPAPAAEEKVELLTRTAREAVPTRPGSSPPAKRPSAAPPRRSSRPPASAISPDPRIEEGRGVYAERVRTSVDARNASMPEAPAPDRHQRIAKLVRELARCGPEGDLPMRQRVLSVGPEALPLLARAFPGALWVDLARPHRPLRSGRQVSAIAACLADFGEPAVPYVPPLLRAARPELRMAAAAIAADLVHEALVAPLAARLSDEVPAVRNAAMIALGACAHLPEMRRMREELIGTLEDPRTPASWRAKAAWALGQLRDARAVPLLVDQLAAEPEVAKIARQSLVLLTGRDLGRFRLRWYAFFKRHGKKPRLEWLIEALDQPEADARARAAEELVLATGEGFDRRHAAATRESAHELAEFYRRLAPASR